MKASNIFLIISFLLPLPSYAGEIALTFDDAPRGDEQIYTGSARTQKIIDVLKKHQIQSMFFVNTERFPKDEGAERIAAYSKAGHLIGNHTHSHLRLRETPVQTFLDDIDKAHENLKSFPTFTPFFRFPYLGEGQTIEVRDKVRSHLKEKGYRNGYVTVDNYDYFINDIVQKALKAKKKVNMDRACDMLTDLMWDGITYYNDIALKHLGTVRHVLLMHENDIEAHCLDKLISRIHSRGWKIISPEMAFNDPLLRNEPDTIYLNQGRIAAFANLKSGDKFVSKWESEDLLEDEFKKRQIVEK